MPDDATKANLVLPEGIDQDIRTALRLPDEKLQKINEWAKSNYDIVLGIKGEESDVDERLGVSSDQFFSALSTIGAFVFSPPGDAPADVSTFVQALKEQGLGEFAEKTRLLLEGIKIEPSRVEFARRRTLALRTVIPTLERVSSVSELRAVFGTSPSPSKSGTHRQRVKVLLGLEPVAMVSITTNDAENQDHVFEFQVTENELKNLIKTLEETALQLQTVKETRTKAAELKQA